MGGYGIAVIAGSVSGNLEIIDFDEGELFTPWCDLVKSQCPGIIERLVVVKTPSGGYHVYFRSPSVERNLKLARRASEAPEESGEPRKSQRRSQRLKTLIETRGEGGYVLAPASPAMCHPKNHPYELVVGELTEA